MKVLTVVTDFDIGGTQRVAQNLTLSLQSRNIDVAILGYRGGGPREEAFTSRNVRVFSPTSELSLRSVLDQITTWCPDIVHIHRSGYKNTVENRLMGKLREAGARIVETNVFARYDRSEARHLIDVHCLLSEWCFIKWASWRPAHDHSCATILPNAVESSAFRRASSVTRDKVRSELGVPPSRFLFGRIGQPSPSKWLPRIFAAFSEEVRSGADVGLLLVGAPPNYNEVISRLPIDVRERIVNLPPTFDDVRLSALFTAMDCFLHLSSIGESFGMVLCEALLCGTPVVTLSTPLKDNSQLEVVGHRKGGLVAVDPSGLRRAMVQIREDTALRERVLEHGRSWIIDRFESIIVADRAIQIYDAVLSARTPGELSNAVSSLQINIPDSRWRRDMQSNGVGRPPNVLIDMAFSLLHTPAIYQAYLQGKQFFTSVSS